MGPGPVRSVIGRQSADVIARSFARLGGATTLVLSCGAASLAAQAPAQHNSVATDWATWVLASNGGSPTTRSCSATLWTLSFGGPIAGSVGWTGECYGYPRTTGPAGQASIAALPAGPTVLVRKWLAIDAGVIVPLTGPQPHALYAGGVYNVGRM